jgi:dTDP-4-amino-4,6-dideoxygalactose transaminase
MPLIPINKPLLDDKEIEAAVGVLKSGVLTSRAKAGSKVEAFERGFAQFADAKHAFAVNSGTTALQLSLLASGVGPGTEVIVPSFTFVATAEVVVLVGAIPVFVDINLETYNIDPSEIKKALTDRTRVIMPVDLFGLPADMKPIKEVAERHGLLIVEDAAQAHGAEYYGKPPGSLADLTCWSFYASKNMTTGEGGMITTDNDRFAAKLPYMRTHGEKDEYVSTMIGGNFRMPELEAAIGIVQLRKLPSFVERRAKNAERLAARLDDTSQLKLPFVPQGYKHSWYLYTTRLERATREQRNKTIKSLRNLGIGAAAYYPVPIHQMPFYRRFHRVLPNTEKAAEQVLSLPIHPGVTQTEIDYIADSVRKVLRDLGAL